MTAPTQTKNIRLTPFHPLDERYKILVGARDHAAAEVVVIKAGIDTDMAAEKCARKAIHELLECFFLRSYIAARPGEAPRGARRKMAPHKPRQPSRAGTTLREDWRCDGGRHDRR